MTLEDFVKERGHGAIAQLARKAGVSQPTVVKAVRGEPIGRWEVAKRISEATGGAVSIQELCEPSPPKQGHDSNPPEEAA